MLFAQAETWIAVGLASVAMIGTVAQMVNNRLTTRDRLEYDVKLAVLTAKASSQESALLDALRRIDECDEDRKRLHAEIESLKGRVTLVEP